MKVTVQYDHPDGSVTIRVTRELAEMVDQSKGIKGFMSLARSASDECCDRAMELGLLS